MAEGRETSYRTVIRTEVLIADLKQRYTDIETFASNKDSIIDSIRLLVLGARSKEEQLLYTLEVPHGLSNEFQRSFGKVREDFEKAKKVQQQVQTSAAKYYERVKKQMFQVMFQLMFAHFFFCLGMTTISSTGFS